ncbi:hypothetical protein PMIN02_009788 [Paraphaeosphaeria minitans]
MPEIGLQGQLRLKNASVLIVGVGGLGCPAAAYLVGAGVGKVGLVDGDTVEESNLHRQILHSTAKVNMTKVESAMIALHSLNPNVELVPHQGRLTPETALSTLQPYDIVLDCTDTPASRYLISDSCVLLGKPLISASALRTDGQLMVLNNPPLPPGNTSGGPCYRCVFPKPPPAESVVTCGDGALNSGSMDYVQFCGTVGPIDALSSNERISAENYAKVRLNVNPFTGSEPSKDSHILVDVREKVQFDLCNLEGSVNVPFSAVTSLPVGARNGRANESNPEAVWVSELRQHADKPIFVVCRRGNDSQFTVKKMKELGLDNGGQRWIGDIRGGLLAWRDNVDREFPEY